MKGLSAGRAIVFTDLRQGTGFLTCGFFPGDESIQVIAEGAKRAEGFLIEQPHGPTAQANLVRISLHPRGPAHFAVPAASERHDSRSRQAGEYDSGPPPAGFS